MQAMKNANDKKQLVQELDKLKFKEAELKRGEKELADDKKNLEKEIDEQVDLNIDLKIHDVVEKYHKKTMLYKPVMITSILYGLLFTILTACRSKAFTGDLRRFFLLMVYLLGRPLKIVLRAFNTEISKGILIAVSISYWIFAIFILGILFYTWFKWFRVNQKDEISAAVALISLAIIVIFADLLVKTPINIILLWFIINIGCMIVRVVLKKAGKGY